MSKRPQELLWEAKPHTIAKIKLLTYYLNAWYSIVGRKFEGRTLCFVDGFAGPGEYKNFDQGSPLAALSTARACMTKLGSNWRAGAVCFIFIDENRDRVEHLTGLVKPFLSDPKFQIALYCSTFESGIVKAKQDHPTWLDGTGPSFLFVDPFGAGDAPFSLIQKLLKNDNSELLFNLDADGAARIHLAGEAADADRILTALFGEQLGGSDIPSTGGLAILSRKLMQLYRSKLLAVPGVSYTFPFEMRSKQASIEYFLLFASKHPLGLEKMKEAMRSIDQTGDYVFCDANVGQTRLFRFDDHASWAEILHKTFCGSTRSWNELRNFALTETPFTNPKKMLAHLEKQGLVLVNSLDQNRRKATYKYEDKIVGIEFLERK